MTPLEAAVTLNLIPGIGSVRIRRLVEAFGTPEIVLHAPASSLRQVQGIGPELAAQIAAWKTTTCAEKELELAHRAGAAVTTLFDPEYPTALRDIPDPPLVLYSFGQWSNTPGDRAVAIVGSRLATHYGIMATRRIASALAEQGITIISGLARGIDTEAHHAAIAAGGQTIAVIGSGLNKLYPRENEQLAKQITEGHGAVVSEFPMDLQPSKSTFPMRNRIVSAWSRATLVIEAPRKSGALITANTANEQGRNVYAVPGPIDRPHSEGCHELIRQGATLVTQASHIIEDMGWTLHRQDIEQKLQQELPLGETSPSSPLTQSPAPIPSLTEDERTIFDSIQRGNDSLDTLASTSGLPVGQITGILAKLQIAGIVTPLPGGFFSLKNGKY